MEKSKLAMLREGIPNHRIVNYPGTDLKVAVVALSSREIIEAREGAHQYLEGRNLDHDTKDLLLILFVLQKALREPDNLENSFSDSIDTLQEYSQPYEIYELHRVYLEVQNGKTLELEYLTSDEFEEIKKQLGQMELKDLDGELQKILKFFHLTLSIKALPQDN